MMIPRILEKQLNQSLSRQAAVALLGPRQVGKTTLALKIATPGAVYLDLESVEDLVKLNDPLAYLSQYSGKLVILDEIQRLPEIFQSLRVLIDQNRRDGFRTGQFLILGSASLELLKQSSESLAGRISYLELTGINALELESPAGLKQLWLRGGFPDSYLSSNDAESALWREDFIKTYLEREVPQLGPRIPATTLRQFWTMLAHLQSSTVNMSTLAENIDVSSPTINRYLDLLVDLLLLRKIPPWYKNTKKRLVKSPKIYVRDSGLLHQLLNIQTYNSLLSHPVLGASWEGFVIENLLSVTPRPHQAFFYRSSGGAEIDLLLVLPNDETWAIEIKHSSVPRLKKGFYHACEDIRPSRQFLVYAGSEEFPINDKVTAISLTGLMNTLAQV